MKRIDRIVTHPLFWATVFSVAAVVANLISFKILAIAYSGFAAWTCGFWLARATPFDRLFRWFMWIRHRRGCGFQHFKILRRETINTHHLDFGWVEIEIPIEDLRLQCPKCGRVHQRYAPGKPRAERRTE